MTTLTATIHSTPTAVGFTHAVFPDDPSGNRYMFDHPSVATNLVQFVELANKSGRDYGGQQVDVDYDLAEMCACVVPPLTPVPDDGERIEILSLRIAELDRELTHVRDTQREEVRKLHGRIDRIGKGVDQQYHDRLTKLEKLAHGWIERREPRADAQPSFRGRVRDAGGGVVEILLDRDVEEYPETRRAVIVTYATDGDS